MSANSYGRAGASLADENLGYDSFVVRRAAETERRTAAILDQHTSPGGAAALHDLDIPKTMKDGRKPNIDHVLVVGDEVWIIDSKWWKPGFYWTVAGATRRGWSRFAAADKQTLAMACDALGVYLAGQGIIGIRVRSLAVVWPSSTKAPLRLAFASMPGAKLLPAPRLDAWTAARTRGGKAANPRVVFALTQLLK